MDRHRQREQKQGRARLVGQMKGRERNRGERRRLRAPPTGPLPRLPTAGAAVPGALHPSSLPRKPRPADYSPSPEPVPTFQAPPQTPTPVARETVTPVTDRALGRPPPAGAAGAPGCHGDGPASLTPAWPQGSAPGSQAVPRLGPVPILVTKETRPPAQAQSEDPRLPRGFQATTLPRLPRRQPGFHEAPPHPGRQRVSSPHSSSARGCPIPVFALHPSRKSSSRRPAFSAVRELPLSSSMTPPLFRLPKPLGSAPSR